MKSAKLLHNPSAGEGDSSKKKLIYLIQAAGYECSYSSTKKDDWEIDDEETDIIVLAGGDGTIRKVAEKLLNKKVLDKRIPIGLLPLGTANNIGKTLDITGEPEDIIPRWIDREIKKFDIGRITGLSKGKFFLESIGFGVFPRLMKAMKKQPKERVDEPEKKMQTALEILSEIVEGYEPRTCTIEIDGIDYSGKFLLVEIMNTASIGPNLNLAPMADPGDGQFEVVLIRDTQRDEFASYIQQKMRGEDTPVAFEILKARTLAVHWDGSSIHVDDQNFKLDKPEKIKIELCEGLLEFLI